MKYRDWNLLNHTTIQFWITQQTVHSPMQPAPAAPPMCYSVNHCEWTRKQYRIPTDRKVHRLPYASLSSLMCRMKLTLTWILLRYMKHVKLNNRLFWILLKLVDRTYILNPQENLVHSYNSCWEVQSSLPEWSQRKTVGRRCSNEVLT